MTFESKNLIKSHHGQKEEEEREREREQQRDDNQLDLKKKHGTKQIS